MKIALSIDHDKISLVFRLLKGFVISFPQSGESSVCDVYACVFMKTFNIVYY